jgi:hypothetical protein
LSAGALRRGRRALDEGDWGEARRLLRDAATASGNEGTAGTAAAWDGIGLASYWLDDGDAAIDAHEQAFAAYREAGERRAAARIAV